MPPQTARFPAQNPLSESYLRGARQNVPIVGEKMASVPTTV